MGKLCCCVFVLPALLLSLGCDDRDPNWKVCIPVTGVITVKGVPAENVSVMFHPEGGMDQAQPTVTQARTDKEGKFAATTYQVADGAPPGNYTLTFQLQKFDPISMTFAGDDLKGKYAKPEKSEFKITVSEEPIDMGTIDL